MKKWLILSLLIAVLAIPAALVGWWLPPLLAFAGTNSEVIQSITSLVQLALWLSSSLILLAGWLWPKPAAQAKPAVKIKTGDQAAVATQGGMAAQQITVVNIQGEHISIADPGRLWQGISPTPLPEELRQATQRYLTYVVDRYQYLDFKGMGATDRIPLRLPLVEMYVPLKARIELPEGETWQAELRLAGRKLNPEEAEGLAARRWSEPQPVLALLQQQPGLIILGNPGAGKTTFLKYLALRLAGGGGDILGLGARLPVLLPLSAYANALAEGDVPLDCFIVAYYRQRVDDLHLTALLAEALKRGEALLRLDGLDEVKELSQRQIVVQRVVDFFRIRWPPGAARRLSTPLHPCVRC
jgi:hypothetical protein